MMPEAKRAEGRIWGCRLSRMAWRCHHDILLPRNRYTGKENTRPLIGSGVFVVSCYCSLSRAAFPSVMTVPGMSRTAGLTRTTAISLLYARRADIIGLRASPTCAARAVLPVRIADGPSVRGMGEQQARRRRCKRPADARRCGQDV